MDSRSRLERGLGGTDRRLRAQHRSAICRTDLNGFSDDAGRHRPIRPLRSHVAWRASKTTRVGWNRDHYHRYGDPWGVLVGGRNADAYGQSRDDLDIDYTFSRRLPTAENSTIAGQWCRCRDFFRRHLWPRLSLYQGDD